MMASDHTWKFFRAGGFDQVLLETGTDLMAIDELDQKLWVALACPTTGIDFDAKTLSLIDTDRDGRIRVPELIEAVKRAGAQRDLIDPFAEKKRPWGWHLAILIVLLLAFGSAFGKFDRVLSSFSPKITSSWIIHHQPPPGQAGAVQRSVPPAEQSK